MKILITIVLILIALWSFIYFNQDNKEILKTKNINMENLENAYFAGGCFWCMEGIFEAQEWVVEALAWYIWWTEETATYEQVSTWNTEHREWVKIIYDPSIISFEMLTELFWTQIDPTDPEWQFSDKWFQYTTAMYYKNDIEKNILEKSKQSLESSWKFDKAIATKILAFPNFFEAEEYHQDYYKKSSLRYKTYKKWSWRWDFIDDYWSERIEELKSSNSGSESDTELKSRLTPLQYKVTQKSGTEPPFDNEYWDNKAEWIYVDIVDWIPLFSSNDKFVSGTGWPSFTKPIDKNLVQEEVDKWFFMTRTEVRTVNSHLWHIFEDGPSDKWWLRYCVNSASLNFIPKEELKWTQYEKYLELFE